jgi:hypothetical protein
VFVTKENSAFTIKRPSLIAKTEKISVLRKKIVGLTPVGNCILHTLDFLSFRKQSIKSAKDIYLKRLISERFLMTHNLNLEKNSLINATSRNFNF